MPEEKFTTVRVYEKDKERLMELHGGPAHDAFHKVITNTCPHPEAKRSYVMAELPEVGDAVIVAGKKNRRVGGFYCAVCGMYIFRQANLLPTVA